MKRHLATIVLGLFVLAVMGLTGFYSWQESNALIADCTRAQNLPEVLQQWARQGGELQIKGRCELSSIQNVSFGLRPIQAWMHGVGSPEPRIHFIGGGETDGILFSAIENLKISDLSFTAPQTNYSNIRRALWFQQVTATLDNLSFYGLATTTPESAAVYVGDSSEVKVLNSKFRGCTSNSANGRTGTIFADKFTRLVVRDTDFYDYGNLDGEWWSRTAQAGAAWINIRNPHHGASGIDNIITTAPIEISNCVFDEGAQFGVLVAPIFEGPPVYWLQLKNNVSNTGITALYYLRWIKYLDIENGGTSWRPASKGETDAIFLSWIERATIRNFWTDPTKSATRLTADGGVKYLQLINSRFTTINSQARVQCETNNGPEVCITR